jgi:S1-C subfamily serine protease
MRFRTPLLSFGALLALLTGLTAFRLVHPHGFPDAVALSEEDPAPRTPEEERNIQVYRQTNKAVVFITTITLTVDPMEMFPEIQPKEGTGSGVIVDATNGVILTNLHVIQDAHRIEITLANGQNYPARLVGYDQLFDLAVLQLKEPPRGLTSIPFGDSSKIEVGQRVLAIGNPFGLTRTLTQGIVSSLGRTMKSPSGTVLKQLIQTDAAINPGNSGGPLLDTAGRLIGINTAILSQSGDSAGIGFAVPINNLKRVLPEIMATGKVRRPDMGWDLVNTDQGPMVLRARENGPAARAGVQPMERRLTNIFLNGYVRDITRADLIYQVNGKRVMTSDEVDEIVQQLGPDEPVTLTLRRGGIDGREREVVIKPVLR